MFYICVKPRTHAFACGAGVPVREIRKEPLYAPFVCLVIYRVPSAGRVYGMGCVEQAACTNAPMHLLNAPMHLLNAPMHQCTTAPIECTNAPIKCTNAPMQLCTNAAMHTGTYAHRHECTRNAHAHQGAYAPAARRTPRRHGVPAAAPHAMPVPRPHTAPRRCPSRCAACASVGRQAGLRRAPLSVEARSGPGRSTASPRSG